MKNSNVEYLIFNKTTGEYITTYYNENTLKTLDLEHCYYTTVNKIKQKQSTTSVKPKHEVGNNRGLTSNLNIGSSDSNSVYDTSSLNPTNVLLYTTLLTDVNNDNGYSSCDSSSNSSSHNDYSSSYSSSSSSDNSYSSSSCSSDSSSW